MRLIDEDSLHEEISKWPESVMYKDWVQSAIANAPTITPPPNNPLTLAQLREMDGEPVWLEYDKCWVLVLVNDGIPMLGNLDGERCKAENWIGLWGNIYRRKPEEETV